MVGGAGPGIDLQSCVTVTKQDMGGTTVAIEAAPKIQDNNTRKVSIGCRHNYMPRLIHLQHVRLSCSNIHFSSCNLPASMSSASPTTTTMNKMTLASRRSTPQTMIRICHHFSDPGVGVCGWGWGGIVCYLLLYEIPTCTCTCR